MEDKKIQIQLHTPILLASTEDAKKFPKSEAVVTITGRVTKMLSGGILLDVIEFKNERGQQIASNHAQVMIPFHKIDHCFVIE